jgi:hypothetical protein
MDLRLCLLFAAAIEPIDNLLVTRALLDLGFEIFAFYPFESEERAIEPTIKVILANIPSNERAAFVDCAT